jgi:hypothetical protein
VLGYGVSSRGARDRLPVERLARAPCTRSPHAALGRVGIRGRKHQPSRRAWASPDLAITETPGHEVYSGSFYILGSCPFLCLTIQGGLHKYLIDTTKRDKMLPQEHPGYLTPQQVAQLYPGLTPRWLARRRRDRNGPPFVAIGKVRLYRKYDVEAFLAAATFTRDT